MNKTKVVLTDKDIADGNRIIAEFMVPNWKSLMGEDYDGGIDGQDLFTAACLCSEDYTNLRYFESFNSLFRAIEKIESLDKGLSYWITLCGHRITIEESHNIYKTESNKTIVEYSGFNSTSKIQNYWCAIVDFIKYHNSLEK